MIVYWGMDDGGTNASAWSNALFVGSYSNRADFNLSPALSNLNPFTDYFYTFTGSDGNISHVGHLGGAVTGFLYLKRAWRVRDFYREMMWRIRRRRFKVLTRKDKPDDSDRWIN